MSNRDPPTRSPRRLNGAEQAALGLVGIVLLLGLIGAMAGSSRATPPHDEPSPVARIERWKKCDHELLVAEATDARRGERLRRIVEVLFFVAFVVGVIILAVRAFSPDRSVPSRVTWIEERVFVGGARRS